MPSALISTGIQFPDNTVQRRAFPSGGILMWYGNIASIPSGWFLCNGSNGTPDLRDRFVVGAGSTYAVNATGGSNTVTLTEAQLATHSHPVTASTGPAGGHTHPASTGAVGTHTHGWNSPAPLRSGPSANYDSGPSISVGGNGIVNPANPHSHAVPSSGAGGDHTHPISVSYGNTGGGGAHENRPPYYALVFIMKE